MVRADRSKSTEAAALVGGVLLSAVLGAIYVYPVLAAVWSWVAAAGGVQSAETSAAPALRTIGPLATTVGYAALIAAGAGVLGLPAGLWIARRGWGGMPLLVVGMLMPSTLAYAGWGLMRAPGTTLGDCLERFAEHGHPWVMMFAGRGLAVLGLVLWSFPIAGLVTGLMLRRVDGAVFESVRMDARSVFGRARVMLRLSLPALGAGMAVVFLLTLGSAIPLHLAQAPTFAIQLWLLMDQTPQDQWWKVWAAAWPMVLLAGLAAWVVGRRVGRGLDATGDAESPGRAMAGGIGASGAATIGIWLLAVGVPVVLLATSVRQASSFSRFWSVSGPALGDSLGVAAMVAGAGCAIALATSACALARGWAGRTARAALGLTVWAAVMPGVLIGALLTRAYAGAWARFLTDQAAFEAMAHVARFGVVAVLMGLWAARTEARTQRDLRRLDGAGTVGGYVRAALPMHLPAAVCAGLFMGAMSLHEIESSVIAQPPGVENFAKQVLQMLHFSRMEELSVAVTYLVGFGLVVASGAGLLARRLAVRAEQSGSTRGRV